MIKRMKERLLHKLEHLRWENLKNVMAKNGMALVVIIIAWEIIEDILFPILFIWLGNNVNPMFLAGVPISWLICLHWLAVPVLWWCWVKIKNLGGS